MRGAFIHAVWVSMLIALTRAAPGPPDTPPPPTDCCIETLPPCLVMNGTCMGQDEWCDGIGWYRDYTDTCKCCYPTPPSPPKPPVVRSPDCSSETLPPCAVMNGTCIGQDEFCNGIGFTNSLFCNYTDTCKCCYPTPPSSMTWTPKPNVTLPICPDGMELIGGCCYSFKIAQKNWTEAESHCKVMGDSSNMTISLAEVGTVEACDANKLMEAVVNKGNDVWLGACDTEEGWMWWETETKLELTNQLWGRKEPKVDGGNCLKAHISTTGHSGKRADFKNAKCAVSKHFVCQLF